MEASQQLDTAWCRRPSVGTWLITRYDVQTDGTEGGGTDAVAHSNISADHPIALEQIAEQKAELELPEITAEQKGEQKVVAHSNICTEHSSALGQIVEQKAELQLPEFKEPAGLLKKYVENSPGGLTVSTAASTPMQHESFDVFSPCSRHESAVSFSQSSVSLSLPLLPRESSCDLKHLDGPSLTAEQPRVQDHKKQDASPTSPAAQPRRRLHLGSISQHLHTAILLFLHGYKAAAIASVATFLAQRLRGNAIWTAFLEQETRCEGMNMLSAPNQCALTAYRKFIAHSSCLALKWYRVPCTHQLGGREGSPAVFCCRGFVFVYGGWSRAGPVTDLHVGRIAHPLSLQRIKIYQSEGTHAFNPSYEMKATVLADNVENGVAEDGTIPPVRVAVTGGYMMGGYHLESNVLAIFELNFCGSGSCPPTACWRYTGTMAARSNHSATYIAPDVAGPRYTQGCLLLFGGTVHGKTVNTVDVLDLEDMTWEVGKATTGTPPPPRNSHSATLMDIGGSKQLLVMGGCTGDGTNGGPPRGGSDLHTAYWLDPQGFTWTRAPEADAVSLGRGHIAVKVCGSVVVIGGGRLPTFQATAFRPGSGPSWKVETLAGSESLPWGRILGGGCALSDGTLMIYGGWHPMKGTFDDVWIAHVNGWITPFCAPLCGLPPREAEARPARKRSRRQNAAPTTWSGCFKRCRKAMVKLWSRCFPPYGYDRVDSRDQEEEETEIPTLR